MVRKTKENNKVKDQVFEFVEIIRFNFTIESAKNHLVTMIIIGSIFISFQYTMPKSSGLVPTTGEKLVRTSQRQLFAILETI